jgi:hypothetical protein
MSLPDPPAQNDLAPEDRLLCLTVLGYRKAGMDEEAYRKHMTEVSAPLTKDLLVKCGILRWTQVCLSTTHTTPSIQTPKELKETSSQANTTFPFRKQIHNPQRTRDLMHQIMDHQMVNIADYDCFSQVIFRSVEDYKRIKDDPWYKEHLVGDHENFADVKRSLYGLPRFLLC